MTWDVAKKLLVSASVVAVMVAAATGTAWAHGTVATAVLSGADQVDGPGDPDGSGTIDVEFTDETGRICFELEFAGIEEPTTVQLHRGQVGETGPAVADLDYATNGTSGCTRAPLDVVEAILADVDAHYVNLTTPAHPSGALRGQLEKPLPPGFDDSTTTEEVPVEAGSDDDVSGPAVLMALVAATALIGALVWWKRPHQPGGS